jgi:2-polyprenyl-3-methyl-5-hydroxy-6-metoxy-1,4-benzoquinol methylase
MSKRYAAAPVRDPESYEIKLAKTREYFTPESEVVELACGTGTTAISHAPYVRRIHATDVSPKMIAICREKAAAAGITNIDFECIGIDEFEKPAGSVDVVMMHSILHLVPDVPAVLRKGYEMLKPGGALVSSTACVAEANILIRILVSSLRMVGLAPYINYFTQRELEQMFADAGFEAEHVWRPGKSAAAFIIGRKRVQ